MPVATALTALAIENVFYTLSVAAMIAAGAIALLFAGAEAGGIELPPAVPRIQRDHDRRHRRAVRRRGVGPVAASGRDRHTAAGTPARRTGRCAAGLRRSTSSARSSAEVFTFASRRRGAARSAWLCSSSSFHALGVAEKHLTLWLILPSPPPLLTSFIVETADRFITVAFKFVPFQVGVGEVGTGLATQILGLGAGAGRHPVHRPQSAYGNLVARRALALLIRRGLTAKRLLEDPELNG